MRALFLKTAGLVLLLLPAIFSPESARAQEDAAEGRKPDTYRSIGGREHDSDVYGVRIGMSVPAALEAVFVNAERKPGQEKPDALRREGERKKDIRVLYKDLPKGELQIVFAGGEIVSEIVLLYRQPPLLDDLRLPYTSTIGDSVSAVSAPTQSGVEPPGVIDGTSIERFGAERMDRVSRSKAQRAGNIDRSRSGLIDGTRYDDRYSIGFTDNLKQQRIWWRDEKTGGGFKIRILFIGKKLTEPGARFVGLIVQKSITIAPPDREKFRKALENYKKNNL